MAIYRHYDSKKYVTITYEKKIFGVLSILFIIICGLYYLDTLWANIIGLIIAIISAYTLNRHEIGRIKEMVLGRIGK